MSVKQADEIIIQDTFFNMRKLWRHLISKWPVLLGAGILVGLLSVLYASVKKPVYTAECTFVLEEKGSSSLGLGQYSALASLAGIDVGSSGLFEGDNIFELYRSRLMIRKTLLTEAKFGSGKQLLIDRYLAINDRRSGWKDDPELSKLDFSIDPAEFTIKHDSIIKGVVKDINKNMLTVDKLDKKLGIISIRFKSPDPLFAKTFTDTIVQKVNTFYIQTRARSNVTNVLLLQKQTDSIRTILNSSMGASASAMDAVPNPNPNMQILRVPSQRKMIDVEANSAMYGEILKNLEIARATLNREMPLFQIIDEPMLPLDNDRISRSSALITGSFAGFLIAAALLSVRWFMKRMYT